MRDPEAVKQWVGRFVIRFLAWVGLAGGILRLGFIIGVYAAQQAGAKAPIVTNPWTTPGWWWGLVSIVAGALLLRPSKPKRVKVAA